MLESTLSKAKPKDTIMQCKICQSPVQKAFEATILQQYLEPFYKCQHCGFLSVGDAHWLSQAYTDALNISDTGIVTRNLYLYKIVSVIAYALFGFRSKGVIRGGASAQLDSDTPGTLPHSMQSPLLVDFGGGSGLLVRLLRDVGIEALWQDEYCENIFARGFEWDYNAKPTLLTSFEVFEHLPNPMEQISAMLELCPNILFSTELLPCPIPQHQGKDIWWYYGFMHRQHISFYAKETLEHIAKQKGVFFSSHKGLHLFSQHKINPLFFAALVRFADKGAFGILKHLLQSKTFSDHQLLLSNLHHSPN